MKNISIKYILLVMLFCATCTVRSNAQLIHTIAGTGVAGYAGDGMPATSARVNGPQGVVTDYSGNVYFSDAANHVIRKIAPSGIISTFAGTGIAGYSGDGFAATAAQLDHPLGICIDRSGNIIVADYNRACIRKISAAGIISTVAGTGVYGYSSDGIPATTATLENPFGVAVDTAGNIYIGDQSDFRVRKVNVSGIINTVAGGGVFGYVGDGGPATMAGLLIPEGLAIDDTGNLYFADAGDQRIRKVDRAGNIWTVAGTGISGFSGDGMPGTAAQVANPNGVATDHFGNVYITDYGNTRIRVLNAAGIINTCAGTGIVGYGGDGIPATAAKFNSAGNAAPDADGNLHIPDFNNYRLRMVGCITKPYMPAISGAAIVCKGSPLPLSDARTGGAWSSSNTAIAIVGSTGIVTGIVPGTATITYTYTNMCGSVAAVHALKVDSIPADAGVIKGVDSVCQSRITVLTDNLAGGTWVSKHPSIATIASTGIVTGVSAGIDTILYIISNTCGADTALFRLKVLPLWLCAAGVQNTASAALSVSAYPDPNNGNFILKVSSPTSRNVEVVITNLLGEKIKEINASTNQETEIKLDVPPGIYFLTALTEAGKQVHKVIIQ